MAARKLLTIAIAGNPNCGKTALFNALTGARQHVGNWPGVTVEKKEGYFELGDRQIRLVDLPGTYALFANARVLTLCSQMPKTNALLSTTCSAAKRA